MADDSSTSRYDQTRHQFDDLEPEEQARFLIEATATTLAQGIERVGRALAHGLQDTVRQARRRSSSGPKTGPGAAEPETAQRQRPRNGSSSASDDA
jgi:hypothetical protein